MKALKGRVWKFGDNVSTDLLMPARSRHGKVKPEEVKYCCMETERPEFAKNVKAGDIMVAGRNFGCGSGRPAMENLRDLGLSCVVAESASGMFFQNSLSMAFPIVICEGVTRLFEEGDTAEVLLEKGEVHNLTKGVSLQSETYPPFLIRIIEEGGLLGIFRQGRRLSELT